MNFEVHFSLLISSENEWNEKNISQTTVIHKTTCTVKRKIQRSGNTGYTTTAGNRMRICDTSTDMWAYYAQLLNSTIGHWVTMRNVNFILNFSSENNINPQARSKLGSEPYLARGPQFANPWFRTCMHALNVIAYVDKMYAVTACVHFIHKRAKKKW